MTKDPVADLMSATDLMPKPDRMAEFARRIKALKFCQAKASDPDHDDCTTVHSVDEVLKAAAALKISTMDVMPGSKRRCSLLHWLYKQGLRNECLFTTVAPYQKAGEGGKAIEATEISSQSDLMSFLIFRSVELGVPQTGGGPRKIETPVIYFEPGRTRYWFEAEPGRWQPMNETGCARKLMAAGCSSAPEGQGLPSEVDNSLLEIAQNGAVDWVGALAGYQAGVQAVNGKCILVRCGPNLLQPRAGKFPVLEKILKGMLGDQRHAFYYWLKVYIESLLANRTQHGQMVILCGPTDTMKSFLQHFIITPLFGGREADAAKYLLGKTDFNGDLAGAEHLFLDDVKPYGGWLSRHDFAENLKSMIVGKNLKIEHKRMDGETLGPRWRISMSINDDEDAIHNLPDLTQSFAEKCMLFKCSPFPLPMPNGTLAEKKTFEETVAAELPCFMDWLLKLEIPEKERSNRFMVRHWHSPELLDKLRELSEQDTAYEVLCKVLFDGRKTDAVELKTSEIWLELATHHNPAFARIFRNSISLGRALSALAKDKVHPGLVTVRVLRGYLMWTIRQKETMVRMVSKGGNHPHPKKTNEQEDESSEGGSGDDIIK